MAEKQKVADKWFVDGDGERSKHASAKALSLIVAFTDGEEYSIDFAGLSEEMARAACAAGVGHKVGDSYSGSAKKSAEASMTPLAWAKEKAEDTIDNLLNGIWISAAEGTGPRVTLLVEAIIRAAVNAGKDRNELDPAKIKTNLADDDIRKAAMENPAVVAEYEALKAENAAARAAKAAEAAADAATDEDAIDALVA